MSLKFEGLCPLIQVFDMPASLRFYRDLLGFQVEMQSAPGDDCDWALLRRDEANLMLNTAYEAPDRPPMPTPPSSSAAATSMASTNSSRAKDLIRTSRSSPATA